MKVLMCHFTTTTCGHKLFSQTKHECHTTRKEANITLGPKASRGSFTYLKLEQSESQCLMSVSFGPFRLYLIELIAVLYIQPFFVLFQFAYYFHITNNRECVQWDLASI